MADLRTVMVDGLSVSTTDQGAQAIEKLTRERDAARQATTDAATAHQTAIAAKDADLAKKDAEIDDLKSKQLTDADLDKRVAARAVAEGESRQRIERSRAQLMQEYAETGMCRRQFLLGYFGEELPEPCGNCDTCSSGSAYRWAEEHDAGIEEDFPLAARVNHETWGAGVVMHTEADRLTVFFDEAGYKVLSLTAVKEGGLLEVLGPAA